MIFLRASKWLMENRSLLAAHEDSSRMLTRLSRKNTQAGNTFNKKARGLLNPGLVFQAT